MNKPLKAGIWYTISNVLIRAISIITAPIFTRLLTTADYGLVNNFATWQNILACVFGLCLSYSIGRAKIDFEDDFNGYISSVQSLSTAVGILLLIIVLPFSLPIAKFMEMDRSLLISLLVLLIFSPSIDFLQAKYRFEYRYKDNVLIAVLSAVGVISISIPLILLSDVETRYRARIFGGIIPTLLIAFVCYYINIREGKKLFVKKYWDYALKYCLPLIPHGLAMIVLAQIDRIMIVKMVGESEAGLYSFGYSYAIILSMVTNAIMFAWQPWVYDKLKERDFDTIIRSNKKINLLGFVMSLFFIAVTPEVIMLLGSKPFWPSMYMVAPVVAGTLLQLFYQFFSMIEMYCKKTIYVGIGSISVAVINIILNYIFIPRFGYVAAAYTTLASYAFLMAYHWLVYRGIFKNKVFAETQIVILSIGSITLCILLPFLYDKYIVRYLLITVLMGIYLWLYREDAKRLVRQYIKK